VVARSRSRKRGLTPWFWKNTVIAVAAAHAEDNSIETEVIIASSQGRTKAWEIKAIMYSTDGTLGPDIPAAGITGEMLMVHLNHTSGLAAIPNEGGEGFIDTLNIYVAGNGTDAFEPWRFGNHQALGMRRDLEQIYGAPEVYVDETLHIYTLSTFSAPHNLNVAVQYRFIGLTATDLFTLREKYR